MKGLRRRDKGEGRQKVGGMPDERRVKGGTRRVKGKERKEEREIRVKGKG